MDFFDRQEKARRNTKLLVAYFAAGTIMLILAVYLVCMLAFAGAGMNRKQHRAYGEPPPQEEWWNPQIFLGATLGTLAVIFIGSAFKTMELAHGGSVVATNLGGRLVNPNTTDPDERKLLNVVEEMAIAAGLPVPQVYLLPQEQGINAFAAGHTTSDAIVAVTEGSIRLLTRDELQGVIGHEFSHILNGDMRMNLRLMGIIFGILCLAVVGRVLLYARSGSSKDKNPLPLLGLALIAIGWIGVLFGRMIQAAVSRQREFLADASAVQFTRNPAGLAGALKKIGGLSAGSKLRNAHAEEASHMFFSNGMGESFLSLMETHPPLAERIRALDPSFDGKFTAVDEDETFPAEPAPARSRGTPSPFNLPGFPMQQGRAGMVPPVIAAAAVMPTLGTPTTAHLEYAEGLKAAIPPALQTAARDPLGASTLVYALLLSNDAAVRQRQLNDLAAGISPAAAQETARLLPQIDAVATRAKLPLVNLVLPGLRSMSAPQFQQFRLAVKKLVESDGQIDLFEYVLQKIVLRHLAPQFAPARKPVVQFYALKPLADDCAVVLSALAYIGQADTAKVSFAFEQGAQPLAAIAQAPLALLPESSCGLRAVDAALDRLSLAAPQIKKNVLNACAQTVAADGVIQVEEAELLRAVADTLDCPIPPFIQNI
jgi:Zn-dependent protease with chaperone function